MAGSIKFGQVSINTRAVILYQPPYCVINDRPKVKVFVFVSTGLNMGRNRSDWWAHFSKKTDDRFKTARALCKYCGETVSSTPRNMSTHYSNCAKVPRSVGQLPSDDRTTTPSVKRTISKTSRPTWSANLSHLISQSLSSEKKEELDKKFSLALNATATPFSYFEHPLWFEFFT